MAVSPSRLSVGTAPVKLAETLGGSGDNDARSFGLFPQSTAGVLCLGGASSVAAAADSVRWDLSRIPALSIDLEPGEALWGVVATGTVDLDVLQNGR